MFWRKVYQKSRFLIEGQKGAALLEALVSVVILSIIGLTFFGSLSAMLKADYIVNERSRAESYSLSQMESIKSQAYIDYSIIGHGIYSKVPESGGHTVQVTATPINPATGAPLDAGLDSGVQKIAVAVSHLGNAVVTLEGYKVRK